MWRFERARSKLWGGPDEVGAPMTTSAASNITDRRLQALQTPALYDGGGPDEVACYRVIGDLSGNRKADAIKVNDDGWRIYIYKRLADEMHAFALTDRIGFVSFENGALAYANLFHIKRGD